MTPSNYNGVRHPLIAFRYCVMGRWVVAAHEGSVERTPLQLRVGARVSERRPLELLSAHMRVTSTTTVNSTSPDQGKPA